MKFKIQINNRVYDVESEDLTGKEILQFGGYADPLDADLFLIKQGNQQELISADQSVKISDPGIERFRIRPKKVNDGLKGGGGPLLSNDLIYLNREFNDKWSVIEDNRRMILKISGFEIPSGYIEHKVDMVIIIPPMYNAVHLDMAYFYPPLQRKDKKAIVKGTNAPIEGKIYQQWSRHRTPDSRWDPSIDCVQTHIELIRYFLREELKR